MNIPSKRYFRDIRRPVYDSMLPCYILDANYHLLDWNPAFDEIFAKPFNFPPGMHVSKFVEIWENGKESLERAMKVFSLGNVPLVDHEPLTIKTEKYGLLKLQKLAAQFRDGVGDQGAWVVYYNVFEAEKMDQLFDDIMERMRKEILWGMYGASFEQLHPYLDGFNKIMDRLQKNLGGSSHLHVLGTGTGVGLNSIIDLYPSRKVDLTEFNGRMREHLEKELKDKLSLVNYQRLTPGTLQFYNKETFDACYTYDGLYRCSDWSGVFQEIYRVLGKKGLFTFLSFHKGTSFDKLFEGIRMNIEKKNQAEGLDVALDVLKEAVSELDPLIRRENPETFKNLLTNAGFKVKEWDSSVLGGQAILALVTK